MRYGLVASRNYSAQKHYSGLKTPTDVPLQTSLLRFSIPFKPKGDVSEKCRNRRGGTAQTCISHETDRNENYNGICDGFVSGRRPSTIVIGRSVPYKCHMCRDFYDVPYGHGLCRFRDGRPNVVRDTCDAGGRITYKSLCIYTTHARRIVDGISEYHLIVPEEHTSLRV